MTATHSRDLTDPLCLICRKPGVVILPWTGSSSSGRRLCLDHLIHQFNNVTADRDGVVDIIRNATEVLVEAGRPEARTEFLKALRTAMTELPAYRDEVRKLRLHMEIDNVKREREARTALLLGLLIGFAAVVVGFIIGFLGFHPMVG